MSTVLEMLAPFHGPRLKLARARTILEILEADIKRYKNDEPYSIETYRDSKTGAWLMRLRIDAPIPPHWAVEIGDFFHNLRSALDNLAIDLVRVNKQVLTRTAIDETFFPIAKSKEGFDKAFSKGFRRTSIRAKRALTLMKPYESGIRDFWIIHRLNILDKHVCLLPAGITSGSSKTTLNVFENVGAGSLAEFMNSLPRGIEIDFGPIGLTRDGDIVGEHPEVCVWSPSPEGLMESARAIHGYTEFSLEIAFGSGQPLDGEPLVPHFERLLTFTDRVIQIFRAIEQA